MASTPQMKQTPENEELSESLGWNLAEIQSGLLCTPVHMSENLQWLTDEVDVSDVIFSWREHLEKEHPTLNKHVVKVKPVLMDMLQAVKIIDELVNDELYKDWDILFTLFGPTSTLLCNTYFIELIQEVHKVLANRGCGALVFTHTPSFDGLEERMAQEYYGNALVTGIMKCILLGLNKVVGSKIDPNLFESEREYVGNISTPGIDGKWSGIALYAIAKEDMEFFCEKLNLRIPLKKGQRVRLSEDIVRAHYYEDSYIKSLVESSGLCVRGICQEPGGLVSSVFIGIP